VWSGNCDSQNADNDDRVVDEKESNIPELSFACHYFLSDERVIVSTFCAEQLFAFHQQQSFLAIF
jgi:hypothetical protein